MGDDHRSEPPTKQRQRPEEQTAGEETGEREPQKMRPCEHR